MEEINLNELMNFFYSKKIIIAIILLITLIIGNIYGLFIVKPMYSSDTSIYFNNNNVNDYQLNKSLMSTYSVIVKSRNVVNQVKNNLNLDLNVDELSKNISVSSIDDSDIIKIKVVDTNPKRAAKIADELTNIFIKERKEKYKLGNASVLDKAQVAESPYNREVLKNNIIYIFIGIIISFTLVFILFYFDTTIKTGEEIEDKLHLTILGTVPVAKNN
jgi:capsular polysaccharide biosynthesis protein